MTLFSFWIANQTVYMFLELFVHQKIQFTPWQRKLVLIIYKYKRKKQRRKTKNGNKKNKKNGQNRWYCKRERERESNELEKIALICDARNVSVKNKIDKHKRIDYIANRRKEKLLFTG